MTRSISAAARLAAALACTLLVAALAAGPAHAGEYLVYACSPLGAGVNNSWSAESSHGGMPSYANCANTYPPWESGLVTRHATVAGNPNATVPHGVYGAMVFRAPAGAGLARILYNHYFCGGTEYLAGLWTWSGWLHYSADGFCGTFLPSPWSLELGGTSQVALMTQCWAVPACHVGRGQTAWASMQSATVTVVDWTLPSISLDGGSALEPGWHRGVPQVVADLSDNVGVRYADVRIDNLGTDSTGIRACDYTRVIPCANGRVTLNARGVDFQDGAHTLSVWAQDTALNATATSTMIYLDNHAPAGPNDLAVDGGTKWRATNRFAVGWTNPAQPDTAPIAGVEFAVCPVKNLSNEWKDCIFDQRSESDLRSVNDVAVPGPGEWSARFWLRDAAGNQEPNTARAVTLRYDPSPPALSLASLDPADPTRLAALASDRHSGLAGGEIEVRQQGTATWTALPSVTTATGFSAALDDESLAEGVYDIRARAIDGAGNERSTDRWGDGSPATVALPVRIKTRLVVGKRKRVRVTGSRRATRRYRHVWVVRPQTRYGRTVTLRGRLTSPGANPLPDTDVEVWEQLPLPGATWRRIGTVRTSRGGSFAFKALRGPSRLLRFRYPGTATVRGRSAELELRVKAATSFRVNRQSVVNGEDVVFRGRLKGAPLPPSSKLIQLQAFSRGQWLTFATPRASHRTGLWSYRYRFAATRGLVRYRFRARVPKEASYPYESGTSRRIHVQVRGL